MPAELKSEADEVVILQTPLNFQAIAQAYQNWHDATDEEVLALMKTWQNQPL